MGKKLTFGVCMCEDPKHDEPRRPGGEIAGCSHNAVAALQFDGTWIPLCQACIDTECMVEL